MCLFSHKKQFQQFSHAMVLLISNPNTHRLVNMENVNAADVIRIEKETPVY